MTDSKEYTNKAECTELTVFATTESQISNENVSKIDITPTKSHILDDQNEEVELTSENYSESAFKLTRPLHANNNDDNLLNDVTMTKDMVIRAVDSLLVDLNNDVKVELTTLLRPEVQKTRREDIQINTIVLRSVVTNENWSKKDTKSTVSHLLEDQREEAVVESDNLNLILNTPTPLYANNKTEIILNDDKVTKDVVISAIDSFLIDMDKDVKVELPTLPLPDVQKTHREGVRMNTTALRREMHIKNRLQKYKQK